MSPPEKIEYFPQWAEPIFNDISKGDVPVKLPEGFKILFAGNIGEAQDFESILKAAEILKDKENIHWVILGDGRRYDYVKEQIKVRNMEKNFHLLGKFPLETMPAFYANADALLLSLKKEYIFSITVPAKVQSYLACGKPVLSMLDGEGSVLLMMQKLVSLVDLGTIIHLQRMYCICTGWIRKRLINTVIMHVNIIWIILIGINC